LSVYCTTKFAIRGFAESLQQEMILGGHALRVTVVHRQVVSHEYRLRRTRGSRGRSGIYSEMLLKMPAARAATIILDGVEANRSRVLVGNGARLVDLIVGHTRALSPRNGMVEQAHLCPHR